MSSIVTIFIILHFKEVLIHYNTHNAGNDCRNADETCENEECHVFTVEALGKPDEENEDGDEEDGDVVHVHDVCLSCSCDHSIPEI